MKLAVLEEHQYTPVYESDTVTIYRHRNRLQQQGFRPREGILLAGSEPLHGFRYVFRRKANDPLINIKDLAYTHLPTVSGVNGAVSNELAESEAYVDNRFLSGLDNAVWLQPETRDYLDQLADAKDIIVVDGSINKQSGKQLCLSDLVTELSGFGFYRSLECVLLKPRAVASGLFGPVVARFESIFHH